MYYLSITHLKKGKKKPKKKNNVHIYTYTIIKVEKDRRKKKAGRSKGRNEREVSWMLGNAKGGSKAALHSFLSVGLVMKCAGFGPCLLFSFLFLAGICSIVYQSRESSCKRGMASMRPPTAPSNLSRTECLLAFDASFFPSPPH